MKRITMLPIAAVLIASMTGCTQPNMTDSQRTKAEGTGVGVLGGALLGAAIGGRQGAAWGAALGGAAGYAYGSHVANEKSKYARQEDWLNACISSAKKVNRDTRSYNAKLSREITKSKRLVRLYKQNKISKSKLRAQKRLIDKERKTLSKKLKNARNEYKAQQGALRDAKRTGNKSQARRLDKQLRIMAKENNRLSGHANEYASLSASMAV